VGQTPGTKTTVAVELTGVLSDHDSEGHARLIWQSLKMAGWLDLLSIKLLTFQDVNLSYNSSDREVWHFVQTNRLLLLTNNRNMEDENSLERTLREENRLDSLPVLTLGNRDRLVTDLNYRMRCADDLVEIVLYLENHLGRARIFIPQL
jgi:hypothetical protein